MNYLFKTSIDTESALKIKHPALNKDSVINVLGKNNVVDIGNNVKGRLLINITGNNSKVIIENDVNIIGILDIFIRRGNSTVVIGTGSTFQGHVRLFNHEPSSITMGADCMFSGEIMATTSDMHAIFDANNERINPAAPIILGEHVWVGAATKILKGVTIGNGSIIGMSSVVTKGIYPEKCIIAGNPCKIVRKNIHWTRTIP